MEFKINPAVMGNMFALPAIIVDENLRLASAVQIKAILYLFRHQMMGESVTCQDIADATGYDREDIVDAMIFWQDRGVTVKDTEEIITFTPIVPEKKEPPKPKTKKEKAQKEKIVEVIPVTKPTHDQVAARCEECEEFRHLFKEAHLKLNKTIGYDGQATIIMLHDSYGLPFEVILMAVEYSVSQQKTGYSSIAKLGKYWSEQGIDTLEGAMEYIEEHNSVNEVWNKLRSLTDISNRTPTSKQRAYLVAWVKEYGYDETIIYYAYEESVDRTGKMSMPYMDKIIRSWYEKGVKTPMDIQREKAKWQEERDKKTPLKKTNNKKVPTLLQDEPSYDADAFMKKAIGLKYNKSKTE